MTQFKNDSYNQTPDDLAYLKIIDATLTEWDTPYDEENFKDLQKKISPSNPSTSSGRAE